MGNSEQARVEDGDETCLVSLWALGERWHVLTGIGDVEEDLSGDGKVHEEVVMLRAEEHVEWMWATRKQVHSRAIIEGMGLEFVSDAAWRVIMEGFRLRANLGGCPPTTYN